MAFSKLKTLLRKMKARTYYDLWKAVGKVCDPVHPAGVLELFPTSWMHCTLIARCSSLVLNKSASGKSAAS